MNWTRKRLRFHLVVIAFYIGVACLGLYAPLFKAQTHIGDTLPTDYYHFNWNYWWMRHALTNGQPIYETDYVLFPSATNLAYHTLTPFWYPVWSVIEPLIGTLAAMQAIIVIAMTLTGWTTFAFLLREGVMTPVALAGGVLLELTPALMLAAFLSNVNYVALFWYPALLLLWGNVARAAGRRTRRSASLHIVVFGVALYGMIMTDYQHALFAAFLLLPYILWTLVRAANRVWLFVAGAVSGGIALMLWWFAGSLPYLLAFDRSTLSPMPIENATGIPFPIGYLWRLSPYERTITIGSLIAVGLVFVGLRLTSPPIPLSARRGGEKRPPMWFWALLMLLPLILSAGFEIGGIQNPFYIAFHDLFGGMFRSPARFAPILILPALVVIGRAISAQKAATQRRLVVGVGLMLLVLADARIFEPMPLRPAAHPPAFYAEIGRETGDPYDDLVVLDVPVAGGSGEAWVGEFTPMEAQLFAMTHEKRIVTGSLARAPLSSFWYWLYNDPMLAWLGGRRYLEPETVETQLRDRIADWNGAGRLGWIIVHRNWIGRESPTAQEVIGFLNSLSDLVCVWRVEGDAVAYRTAAHPDGCDPRTPPEIAPNEYRIDVGAADDARYLGWGWHYSEPVGGIAWRWVGAPVYEHGNRAVMYVELPPADYIVSIQAQAYHEPRHINLTANGIPLGENTVGVETLTAIDYVLPMSAFTDGDGLTLTLEYDAAVSPESVGQGGDTRPLAVAVDSITFRRNP